MPGGGRRRDASPDETRLPEILRRLAPDPPRLFDWVHTFASAQPHGDAVIDGSARLTYRRLAEVMDLWAAATLGGGVRLGDRVALLDVPGARFIGHWLGVMSVGAVWMGLNPRHPVSEWQRIIRDATPRLLVTPRRLEERNVVDELEPIAREVGCTLVVTDDLEPPAFGRSIASDELVAARRAVRPDSAGALVYTSGSSGIPKGALLPHAAIVRGGLAHIHTWGVLPVRLLHNLPIGHVGSLVDITATALVAGGTVVCEPRFDGERSLRAIDTHRVTVWFQIPTQFELTLQARQVHRTGLSSVQLIVWSGAPASAGLLERLQAICPRLATTYSQTESVGSITLTPPMTDTATLEGTIGWPDPGRDVRRIDEHGAFISGEGVGEIVVRDDYRMLGYLNPLAGSSGAIDDDGWLRTGDLACGRPDGAWHLVGRRSLRFRSGGYYVDPLSVERVLESHPMVQTAVVVPVADPLYGEVGVGFVIPVEDAEVDLSTLRDWARTQLPVWEVPKAFHVVPAVPVLPVGKVDRAALKKEASQYLRAGSAETSR